VTLARLALASRGLLLLGLAAQIALSGCTSTTDSLGHDDARDAAAEDVVTPPPTGLRPLSPRAPYPNPFVNVLGRNQTEIDAKIDAAFNQLFHGNPDTEAVYFTVGADEARIEDIFHQDVRTEGMGFGMMIAVQLDRRDEFDRLWRHAKSTLRESGMNDGYYTSFCDSPEGLTSMQCIDPFGMEQFAMSLVFAHGRWGSDGSLDYETDALELLDVMQNKEEQNGGIKEEVTNVFNAETALPSHEPTVSASSFTRPSIVIPAYYALWAEATGNAFWTRATNAGREYLKRVSHPTTGLMPLRAYMDGSPVDGGGFDAFRHEAYRTELNIALDEIWHETDDWAVLESDRLLGFFVSEGINTYGKAFTLDGMVLDPMRETALVAANGSVAAISTRSERAQFFQAVWEMQTPTGPVRYYSGMMDLLALLVLGGRFQVH
jgi:oligosaccharide reducing-end xylanase